MEVIVALLSLPVSDNTPPSKCLVDRIAMWYRFSFRNIVQEGQKSNVTDFGGPMYRVDMLHIPAA